MFKKVHVFRIKPGQEIITEISRYCKEHALSSGIVTGVIGSVTSAQLNFLVSLPGNYEGVDYKGPLEIVCAQGSIALKDAETIVHIHIQLSSQDMCRGGHLAQAIVFSTAEVAIGELDFQLSRQLDSYTGLNELVE
jgi:predicted DNA-binding protein with PD1-like motif